MGGTGTSTRQEGDARGGVAPGGGGGGVGLFGEKRDRGWGMK